MLRFVLQAAGRPDQPHLLILDEMNLAHVERYFADFLSGMESGRPCLPNLGQDDGSWRIREGGPREIPIPDNLFVVGTVNVDETTYMFSPKVLDRANTFEFRVTADDLLERAQKPECCRQGPAPLLAAFLKVSRDDTWHNDHPAPSRDRLAQELRRVHALLGETGFEFGHRIYYEAQRFGSLLAAAGESSWQRALDLQILQKVLPRLHGSRRRLEPTLVALAQYCFSLEIPEGSALQPLGVEFDPLTLIEGQATLPESFDKIRRMTRNLRANQFTSFTD